MLVEQLNHRLLITIIQFQLNQHAVDFVLLLVLVHTSTPNIWPKGPCGSSQGWSAATVHAGPGNGPLKDQLA